MMNNFPYLPEAMVAAILARVPAKSMMRFRCVSKSFNSFIHDPYFLNLRQSKNPNKNHFLFVCPDPSNCHGKLYEPQILLGELPTIHEDQAHLELNTSTHVMSMPNILASGSNNKYDVQFVNGLLCFHHKLSYRSSKEGLFRTYICNPTTRQVVTIPEDTSTIDRNSFIMSSHFGHDPIQDNFKVLRIIYNENDRGYFELKILTVGGGKWRDVTHNMPYSLRSSIGMFTKFNGTCINGAIYWVDRANKVLGAFDVGAEQFREISVPNKEIGGKMKLIDLDGNLCLVTQKDFKHIRLSRLKDYQNHAGIHQNMIITLEIPENIEKSSFYKIMIYLPVCRVQTGEILLVPEHTFDLPIIFLFYDEKKRSCGGALVKGIPSPVVFFTGLGMRKMLLFAYQENFQDFVIE